MTYEEALNQFNSTNPFMHGSDKQEEYFNVIRKALEKQIPKKPIRANRAIEIDGQLFMNDDNEFWKCPMCTLYDVPLRENQRYCHYCGQALDWGDTDDRS